jgi:RNA polymerase sigma-70 factor (ECF subfamily)
MVSVRMDPLLTTRVDPSDIVQDSLMAASQRLPAYLQNPAIPFYPWLRRIAWDRLVEAHRQHLWAKRRSRLQEEGSLGLSNDSVLQLAEQFVARDSNPSARLLRDELLGRVRQAMEQLEPVDREVLMLRYLEQLSPEQTAAVLGIGQDAERMRHLRAVQRLRRKLNIPRSEDSR